MGTRRCATLWVSCLFGTYSRLLASVCPKITAAFILAEQGQRKDGGVGHGACHGCWPLANPSPCLTPHPCRTEGSLLADQVESVKEVAEYVSQLRRVGKGLGVFEFDRKMQA